MQLERGGGQGQGKEKGKARSRARDGGGSGNSGSEGGSSSSSSSRELYKSDCKTTSKGCRKLKTLTGVQVSMLQSAPSEEHRALHFRSRVQSRG